MGLVYMLTILSNIFNLIARPSFTLMCPLYASIRAVESDKHYNKCLAYWVLFSITTVLESVLSKLLQWIPFWPYAKGIATLLLVVPYFDGASYVYTHLIKPYMCVNLQVPNVPVISETKECLLNEQNGFLDAEETHIEEKEEEENVKLDICVGESRTGYDNIEIPLVRPASPKKVQKEWSCTLCLVSTTSKKCLGKHLQGKRHKEKEDELRQEEVVAKTTSISSTTNRSNMMILLDSFNHISWVNLEKLTSLLSPVTRSIRWCTWRKPKFGWTKLNTDGSIDRDNAGFGGLFRDYKGNAICAYVSKAPKYDNIFLVELWSIWRGLVLASGLGIKTIWVESDSMSAVNTINRKQPYGPKASSCMKHIWDLLKKFEKYQVSHSWRETNRAADYLSKMYILGSSDIVLWPNDFPSGLCKIVKDDAEGRMYRRGILLIMVPRSSTDMPLFTLMCPLYASIRVVKSDKHYHKCLTYWVLFSITTVFESVLWKLLKWIPFCPYAKGIATLLLVVPYFDGASYVYTHFIRPYMCVNLQVPDVPVISEIKECLLNEQNGFLNAAKTHIDEK